MPSITDSEQNQPVFIRQQFEFAANIRDPNNPAPTDIEDRRMSIYRELFYNNVEDFMANSYPVTREILGESRWHDLIRDYYSRHEAKTPLFPHMPAELLDYLKNERVSKDDPPFLLELAHYEWAELALAISSEEIDLDNIDANGSLIEFPPALSSLILSLCYEFPVHKISKSNQPQMSDGPSFLVVYRDRLDEVKFLETNSATHRLLQLIAENPMASGNQLLNQLASEFAQLEKKSVMHHGQQALEELKAKGIILGAKIA